MSQSHFWHYFVLFGSFIRVVITVMLANVCTMRTEKISEASLVQEYKENPVQDILRCSVNEEIEQSSGSPPSSPECCKSLLAPLWENLSELTDNLILTSAANVSEQTLKTLNISCIICCAPELPDSPLIRDQVIYHKIHVRDSWDSKIFQHFDDTADLIQHVSSLGGRTLVFCVAGVSRSATICIAYLMKHHKLTLLNAYNFAKLRRPKIRPNSGFFRQLIEYEKELFNCNTVHMIYNEFVHMEIPDVYDRDYKTVINQHKKRYNGRR